MTIKGIGRGAREVFLTFGALLGVLCIVATIAGVAFGVKPLVFRSGSMSPAIHTGDLAVSRTVDASSLKTGDIVSVVNSEGNRVTHRLVNIASQGDARQLTLKGDDNRVADTEVYTVTKAERVLFDIPKAGYVVNAAASPYGIFALGVYVTAMLLLVFRRKRPEDDSDGDAPSPSRRRQGGARKADSKRARATARTVATTAFAAAFAVASPASAHWIDDAAIAGGSSRRVPRAEAGPHQRHILRRHRQLAHRIHSNHHVARSDDPVRTQLLGSPGRDRNNAQCDHRRQQPTYNRDVGIARFTSRNHCQRQDQRSAAWHAVVEVRQRQSAAGGRPAWALAHLRRAQLIQ